MKQKFLESLRNILGWLQRLQAFYFTPYPLHLPRWWGSGDFETGTEFQLLNLYGTSTSKEFLLVSLFSKVFHVDQGGKETTMPSPQRCQVFERWMPWAPLASLRVVPWQLCWTLYRRNVRNGGIVSLSRLDFTTLHKKICKISWNPSKSIKIHSCHSELHRLLHPVFACWTSQDCSWRVLFSPIKVPGLRPQSSPCLLTYDTNEEYVEECHLACIWFPNLSFLAITWRPPD